MFIGQEIHKAVVRTLTGLRNRDLEELVEGKRFPPPVRDDFWSKEAVQAWIRGTPYRIKR